MSYGTTVITRLPKHKECCTLKFGTAVTEADDCLCFASVLFAFLSTGLFDLTSEVRVDDFQLVKGKTVNPCFTDKTYSDCLYFSSDSLLQALHIAASSMLLPRSGPCTWAQRTPFLKPTMADLKTSSRISLKSECAPFSLCCLICSFYCTITSFCKMTYLFSVIGYI